MDSVRLIENNSQVVDKDYSILYYVEQDNVSLIKGATKSLNTHNGFEYVDLGLPSGTLWATCNVGATEPEEYGKYFQWGDTVGYEGDDAKAHSTWETTPYYSGNTWNSYRTDAYPPKTVLSLEDDAAHFHMRGDWRMPTKEDMDELIANTTSELVEDYNGSGVNGRLFTSKTNGNSMFVPASGDFFAGEFYGGGSFGYLWSSSLDVDYPYDAWNVSFDSDYLDVDVGSRFLSLPVRGVLAQDSQFIEDANQEEGGEPS